MTRDVTAFQQVGRRESGTRCRAAYTTSSASAAISLLWRLSAVTGVV